MESLERKLNSRAEMRFIAAAARKTQALGRTTQAAHSTIAVGDSDVPLVEAVDTAVSVGEEIPQVSEEAGLAGDDAWEAWDQSEFAKHLSEAAAQVAEDAKTSADGKSRVVRSTSAATAAGSYKDGDQWWQFSGANIVGLWLHDGTDWVQQVVTNQIIASLDAGKITSGVIAADRIGSNSITTAKLESTAIDGMTITGAVMRTAASGQRLQLDAVGLRAFNASGSAVATLLSSGGNLSLNGGLSLLDGANASGSVSANGIQTSLSAYPRAGATRSNGFRHLSDSLTATADVKFGIFSGRAGRFEVSAQYANDLGPFRGRVTVNTEDGAELNLYSRQTASSPQVEFGIRPLGTDGYFVGCHPMSYMRFAESEIEFRGPVKFQGDTDWATVSVPGATGTCEWRRFAGVIYVRFDVTFSTAVPVNGTKDPMVTLPVAPAINVPLNIYGHGSYSATGFVEATGRVVFRNTHSIAASRFIGAAQWLDS